MNIPVQIRYTLKYYDTDSPQFQLTEDNVPVSETLSEQTIKVYIRNGESSFTDIEKDVVVEGWITNENEKKFKIVIDTEGYLMLSKNGLYHGRIEWLERKLILVSFTIDVEPQELWSV